MPPIFTDKYIKQILDAFEYVVTFHNMTIPPMPEENRRERTGPTLATDNPKPAVHPLSTLYTASRKGDLHVESLTNPHVGSLNSIITMLEIQQFEGFDDLLSRFLTASGYDAAKFEAVTCQFYAFNEKVELLRQGGTEGLKSPDLLLDLDGKEVYIECTSMEDLRIKENPHNVNLDRFLEKKIKNEKRRCRIAVTMRTYINHDLLLLIKETIDRAWNDMWPILIEDEAFSVQLSEIEEKEVARVSGEQFRRMGLEGGQSAIEYIV